MNADRYKLTIAVSSIVAYSENLDALIKLAKSADRDFEGRLGWEIVNAETRETVRKQKAGLNLTFVDLCTFRSPSPRLYSCLLRHVVETTGRGPNDVRENITLRDIRDMMLGGKFVDVRNMNLETRKEFYDMLIEFCGDTRVTRLAINQNIELHEAFWLKHNPDGDPLDCADLAVEYLADLSENYYQQFPY